MVVLITGGSGFIGSHAVDKLIGKGHSVRILDVISPHRNDVDYLEGSILDSNVLSKAVNGVDVIFHFAGVSNIDKVKNDPLKTIEYNILGTAKILESARLVNIKRFIMASSVYVYDIGGHLYTYSKKVSEDLCCYYQRLYGLPYTIMRLATAYGPRSRGEDVISIFVKNSIAGSDIRINGGGSQIRNFIYIDDLSEAFFQSLSDKCINKTLTIAGNEKISILELGSLFNKIFGVQVVINPNNERISDYSGKVKNIQESYKILDWEPSTSLESGIIKYADWYNASLL